MVFLIQAVFQIFSLLILARTFMSWLQPDPNSPIVQFLHNVTEPFLAPIRQILPPAGMFDFSPIVVLVLAQILAGILTQMVGGR